MSRTTLNLAVDLLAAVLLLAMIATGYIIRFPLPPGTNKELALWGLSRHEWGGIHFWVSLGLLGILATHLVLHWQWVVSVIGRRLFVKVEPGPHAGTAAIVILTVVSFLAAFAWLAQQSVTGLPEPCCPPGGAETSAPTEKPAQEMGAVSFREVYPILERSCLSCHGPQQSRGNFRVDQRGDYFGKNGQPPLIIPGKSDASPLIAIISGAREDIVFPHRHRLPDEEVQILKKWIDAGAHWPN